MVGKAFAADLEIGKEIAVLIVLAGALHDGRKIVGEARGLVAIDELGIGPDRIGHRHAIEQFQRIVAVSLDEEQRLAVDAGALQDRGPARRFFLVGEEHMRVVGHQRLDPHRLDAEE